MINTCVVCGEKFEGREGSKFDKASCRVAFHRSKKEGKVESISVIEKKSETIPEVTSPSRKSEYTVEQWRRENPNPTWTPNWITRGYASREEAIRDILRKVRTDKGVLGTAIIPDDIMKKGSEKS